MENLQFEDLEMRKQRVIVFIVIMDFEHEVMDFDVKPVLCIIKMSLLWGHVKYIEEDHVLLCGLFIPMGHVICSRIEVIH